MTKGFVLTHIIEFSKSGLLTLPNEDKNAVYDGPDLKLFIVVGWDWRSFVCCLVHRGSTDDLILLQIFSGVVV